MKKLKLHLAVAGGLLTGLIVLVATASAAVFLNTAPITIIDGMAPPTPALPYPSSITVSGLSGTVKDVNVTLTGFGHAFPDDVDILLVGPTGANTLLMSDACGSVAMSGVSLTFDDAAASFLPDAGPCASGSYKPSNYLATADVFPAPAPAPSATVSLTNFTGTAPNGTWSLYVVDDLSGDAGTITGGWSLTITSATTAVELAGLRATRVAGGVALTWRTASELDVAGFDVYRGKTKLNRALIAAKRAGTDDFDVAVVEVGRKIRVVGHDSERRRTLAEGRNSREGD